MRYNLILALLLSAHLGLAIDVTKVIKKNFSVSSNTKLSVRNSFGKVHINNWEKSEFGVEVEVIGKSSREEKAQEIADRINIDIRESSDMISFETELDNIRTRNNEGYEINYTINMPSENPIRIINKFGDIYLDERFGEADIDVSYGALRADDLNEKSSVKVAFGKGSIDRFERGEIEIKYSDVDIESSDQLEMDQQFSNVELNKVNDIELESKYGSVDLGIVGSADVDVSFSGFKIDELSGSLDMEAGYVSGFEIDLLRNSFESVYITGKFGSYDIRLEEGLSADIEAEFKYSDLKVRGADVDFHYRVKENNSSEYRGKIGGGDPNKKIVIRSSYGNCNLY